MSQTVAGRRAAAVLAALALTLGGSPALAGTSGSANAANRAQTPPATGNQNGQTPVPDDESDQLDPGAPLESWPDLGVDWPDLDQPDELPEMAPEPEAAPPPPGTSAPDVATVTPEPPASAQPPEDEATVGNSDAAAARRHDWRITGLDAIEAGDEIMEQFRGLSTLQEYRGEPANAAQIDRRAQADGELLEQILRSHGYYNARVFARVSTSVDNRFLVRIRVRPGQLYTFSEVRLPGLEEAPEADRAALRAAFDVEPQQAVDAASVEVARAALEAKLGLRGYAFAEVGEPDVLIDHESRTAVLTLAVRPNGVRRFGSIIVEGDRPPFGANHVDTIARFRRGDQYRADRIDDLRQALVQTGLVSTVNIRAVPEPDSDLVDLHVRMEPAPVHTIAGEAGYGTGEGFRIEGSWTHRNLIVPEGAVTLRGVLGTREQTLSGTLRQSNWHERDQTLNGQVAVSHVDRPGFEARTAAITGGIERQSNIIWQKKWTWSAGAELLASDETDVDVATGTIRRRTFFIGAVPLYLGYDGSDDLLDPHTGFRLSMRVSPEASLQSGSFFYTRAQFDGSIYRPVSDRIVLAARTRLGTIVGADRDRIAPSRRFYAGGGGSVRGYGYQAIGPRDPVFDDPIGGRSLAEFSIEARVRFGNFGIVPFLDAGNISTSALPQFDHLQVGAGLGVRYYSSFGPIRIDVGTPLNRRPGDPRIAVYVSLGQAF
jgi:translocation and assembly module TamA